MCDREKHDIDLFIGTGGGPEGVLAASALDAYGCGFQGRFIFDTDKLKKEQIKWELMILIRNITEIVKETVFAHLGLQR